MLIRIDDPSLVDELCENFRRAGFSARPAAPGTVVVTRPDTPSREQERREIEVHLCVWGAIHPGSAVEIVGLRCA